MLPTHSFFVGAGEKFYRLKQHRSISRFMGCTTTVWTSVLLVASAALTPPASGQRTFASPADAAEALSAAIAANDSVRFRSIAGLEMREVLDAFPTLSFLDEAPRTLLKRNVKDPNRIVLFVGDIGQPFPAPLVYTDSGWLFDAKAGVRQTADHRIRRNEAAVRELCLRYLDAQIEYSNRGGGIANFAQKIRSTPGQTDGLYWSNDNATDESPLGPSFAYAAFMEPQPDGMPRPLFGYYFKILLGQGSDADGGSTDYRVNGVLRNGFALVAWPAKYGYSGQNTYIINHLGSLYQNDLGVDSGRAAAQMNVFNPDRSWTRVPPDADEE